MERNPRFVGTTYLVREIERYAPKIVTRRNDNDKVRDGKNGGGGRGEGRFSIFRGESAEKMEKDGTWRENFLFATDKYFNRYSQSR